MNPFSKYGIGALLLLLPLTGWGQGEGIGESVAEGEGPGIGASLVTVLAPLLWPKFVADGAVLKEWIRDEEFRRLRESAGDRGSVDSLFSRAKELSWGNLYEALLITTAAVMDHRRVGVDLPIFGSLLWFPLTSEFEEEFQARVAALPSALYPDSPMRGDRDKLQHFFGSAFVAYLSESADAAARTGDFVEWGEAQFIVGGADDPRDMRANREGQRFGIRLLVEPGAQPSMYLGRSGPAEAR